MNQYSQLFNQPIRWKVLNCFHFTCTVLLLYLVKFKIEKYHPFLLKLFLSHTTVSITVSKDINVSTDSVYL